ncbi:MAG TPA: hypothetical protein GXX39_02700 [Syntrophothermus lipocalidus]|nr:hypothetical protein [Syntrophothermus lipocalidus]
MRKVREPKLRMVRKQTYIMPEQDEELKKLAEVKQVAEAEVIREALDSFIRQEKHRLNINPLRSIIGISGEIEGPEDGSAAHDRYIYGRRRL